MYLVSLLSITYFVFHQFLLVLHQSVYRYRKIRQIREMKIGKSNVSWLIELSTDVTVADIITSVKQLLSNATPSRTQMSCTVCTPSICFFLPLFFLFLQCQLSLQMIYIRLVEQLLVFIQRKLTCDVRGWYVHDLYF